MSAVTSIPRSRITLTYDTRQPDQPRKEKELPLRLLILGDLTGRTWKAAAGVATEPGDELDRRPIHNLNGRNLDAIMEKLRIAVELGAVANHVSRDGAPFPVRIPITSMASFEPGQVVQHVPPAARLLELRKLVLELQAHVDNNKKFRRLIRELTSPARAGLLAQLRAELTKQLGAELRVPTRAELDTSAVAALPAAAPPQIAAPAATTTPATPAAPPAPATKPEPPKDGGAA